ncbi:alpha-1,4-glucan--maltose-1-phosphate maltosyltransferase [Conyzicola nivalis]|uniref:alpha-1,4-glucan--maltose-1-phosphate maltosyltransferase n=1 Tax=Conyzicola nivalis TaxID=1477021 RepID=UPI001662D886
MATTENGRVAASAGPTTQQRYETRIGRIPIRFLNPQQPENRWPAKAFVGEVLPFSATVFREGHDQLGAALLLTDPRGTTSRFPLHPGAPGTDAWHTSAQVDAPGTWIYRIQAYSDDWATWLHNAEIKIPAGIDVDVMITMGLQLLARLEKSQAVADATATLSDATLSPVDRLEGVTGDDLAAVIAANPLASLVTLSDPLELRVERARAGLGSWYEFFPRSEGAKQRKDGSWASGTFRTAAKRLPAVADMGFDVVYLPPIHPIGRTFRKGPNNTLDAGPNDPGSPWAIGSADGGHDAIHPELGTVKDFSYFLGVAKKNGIEIAIDLALQCSPDHPWVTQHPEWFTTLPDGSIAYAENPPKKYQDIYPINFDNDYEGLRQEILRIVKYWIGIGVTIFRVDNPHTKPLEFWEWLLHEVAAERPDVVFFAEAFTRPAMMQSLAAVGFQQSYTYFTWRNTKVELEEYLHEVSKVTSHTFRPNFFVNTPDILTEFLQFGGRPAYKVRAAIAATGSPSWGVYSGYELFENVARPGAEENIDNEKFEYKVRDYAAAEETGDSLAPYLRRLNEIRAQHPALHQLRNLDVHWSDDDSILVYSKYLDAAYTGTGSDDTIIVVANVDPHSVRETTVHLDTTRFGIEIGTEFTVTDLITGSTFVWGGDNYVRLDAFTEPVHILRVEYPKGN